MAKDMELAETQSSAVDAGLDEDLEAEIDEDVGVGFDEDVDAACEDMANGESDDTLEIRNGKNNNIKKTLL